MSASLNSLRKFLRNAGCIEERSFGVVGRESLFIEFVCRMKTGRSCRAMLATDGRGGLLPDEVLADIGRELAPCLGRGWTRRIPEEDPFG
jgi:hypothetical protein